MTKILIASDLEGNFPMLIKKIEKFDLIFCLGKTLKNDENLEKLLNNKIKITKPVYFTEEGDLAFLLSAKFPEGGEIAKNLHYLGPYGLKIIQGFKIGYFSSQNYLRISKADSDQSEAFLNRIGIQTEDSLFENFIKEKEKKNIKNLDLLLTTPWPNQFEPGDQFANGEKSEFVSKLAYEFKPRYHICTGQNRYHLRKPYINYDEKLNPSNVTRLVCLASFPSETTKPQGKYLYAFKTQTLDQLPKEKKFERPDDTTENPYLRLRAKEEVKSEDLLGKVLTDDLIFSQNHFKLSDEKRQQIEELADNKQIYIGGFSR